MKIALISFLVMMVINASGQESRYIKISNKKTTVAVDIECGGRIMEYSYNGNNIIFVQKNGDRRVNGPDGGRCDFGPEKIVPPRPETWEGSWELAEKKEYYIKIKSGVAKEAGVYLIREFMLHETTSHLEFTQHIINVSDSPKRYSHWSRTFAEPNGICLAPVNPNSRFPKGYMVYMPDDFLDFSPEGGKNEQLRDGILEISGPSENAKFVTDDSNGWLAYISRDNQLFIKKFQVFDDKIYGEMTGATASVWYNEKGVCEIEPLGPWEWIKPGESISFTENWYLTNYNYPEDKKPDLIEIRELIKKL